MSPITDDEVAERVAEAIYGALAQISTWSRERTEVKNRYRETAHAAIKAHKEAYRTPYADEGHQGGNLLEWFILVAGRASRAEAELRDIRVYALLHSGEPIEDDDTTLRAVQLLHSSLGGWQGLAKIYGGERDDALAELEKTRAELKELKACRQAELDKGLYDMLMAFAKKLQTNVRTGQERGAPNEIARDDGYGGGLVDAGEELEALLTPRPSTFSLRLERSQVELEKTGLALADVSRALGEAYAELSRRQRQGQAALNTLAIVRPDLHAAVIATPNDPFHNDDRLGGFFTWLADVILAEKAQARVDADNGARYSLEEIEEEFNTHG